MALSVYHVDFYFIEFDLSLHGLFHPDGFECELISAIFDEDIFAFLFVFLHEGHEFCIVVDLFEVLLSRLLDVIV